MDCCSPEVSCSVSSSTSLFASRRIYHRKTYTSPCAIKTCSMVYSKTGIWIYARVRSSARAHMELASGIPKLVVLAAPQKHTAIVCSLVMRLNRTLSQDEEAILVSLSGGLARRKQITVKSAYNAIFMKTRKRTLLVDRSFSAPVPKAPENVVQTSRTRHIVDTLASLRVVRTLTVRSSHFHLIAWPTMRGKTTLRQSCLATYAYMCPRVEGSAGRQSSKTSGWPVGKKP